MDDSSLISRRDFLKIGSLGITSIALKPFRNLGIFVSSQYGRVIYDSIMIYDQPSFESQGVKQLWADAVILISEVTIGDTEPQYNRVWYKIGDDGYTHSGGVQPVLIHLNDPITEIPKGGQLAEVTVPYTDVRWYPDPGKEVAYRFYYETTYWVVGLVIGKDNNPWYQILDDKWDLILYAPAKHLRLIPVSELTTLSPNIPSHGKRIEVRITDQVVIAYEWDKPVFAARIASGAEFSNGEFFTSLGTHSTFHKRGSRHMAAGNLAYNGYDLPGVPWVCYFTEQGEAFHGTYWHNDFGRPRSHGCINMTPKAAKWIYRWTLPLVPPEEQRIYDKSNGTRIDVI
jgi:hypothetical protein